MEAEGNFSSLQGDEGENVEYYNSKFSNSSISDENITISSSFKIPEDNENYATLNLATDPHFDNVLVNVTHSSVHVPTNIFDRCKRTPILHLDTAYNEIFVSVT